MEPDLTTPRELSERKAAVLRAVVEAYVETGEPVGSETIAGLADLGVSPATIRNELSALEEMGYLGHPHTSSGRVPTDLGYRFFVNSLPGGGKLRQTQKREITDFFAQTVQDLEETLVGAAQLLSRLTQYAGLAVPPSAADERVIHVELVGVGSVVLAIVVGQHGRVDKRAIDRPDGIDDIALADLSDRLARALAGRSVPDVRTELDRMGANAQGVEATMLVALADVLDAASATTSHMLVRGVGNLASEAATWRRETVTRLFDALEREQEMLTLMRGPDGVSSDEVRVTIGAEHPSTGEWDAALVTAPYGVGGATLGTVGVVGPTRMDYVTAIATVRAVARRISELAAALGA